MHTIKLFSEQDKEAGLKKLHSSLNNITKLWIKMSKLMEDVKDPALFQRAFSPGLQEFIEALCFLAMVESSELPSCDQVIIFFHTNLLKVLFLRNGIEDMNSSFFPDNISIFYFHFSIVVAIKMLLAELEIKCDQFNSFC